MRWIDIDARRPGEQGDHARSQLGKENASKSSVKNYKRSSDKSLKRELKKAKQIVRDNRSEELYGELTVEKRTKIHKMKREIKAIKAEMTRRKQGGKVVYG